MALKEDRKQFCHSGRVIYQWDESLDSIIVFIAAPEVPPSTKLAILLDIKITSQSLTVGLKGTNPYLSHEFQGVVDSEESVWYLQEGKKSKEIVIELQKAQKGVRWSCIFKGHDTNNVFEEEQLKKKLLLERFQQQNPTFDFSGAEFNGQVPEARTFMGGVKYS